VLPQTTGPLEREGVVFSEGSESSGEPEFSDGSGPCLFVSTCAHQQQSNSNRPAAIRCAQCASDLMCLLAKCASRLGPLFALARGNAWLIRCACAAIEHCQMARTPC
jgi:hypothetical protein